MNYGEVKRSPVINNKTDEVTKLFANTILKLGQHEDLYGTMEVGTMLEVMRDLNDIESSIGGTSDSV